MHGTQLTNEPIAIIGMGCRFPGHANSPEAFWDLLANGVDAIVETPADRWSGAAFFDRDAARPGHMWTRWGGFVDDIMEFDAAFFGITPREAARMDPQQRLFLETTWQALQDAGIVPEVLAGSKTAVYAGVSGHDYGILQLNHSNRCLIGGHTMSGVTNCIVANRVSYLLDLRGPSMVVDTACSSSLVAIHLACRSLRTNEATLAIAGGVGALLNPEPTIAFSQGTFLSPDGRCKAFDRSANGYVRGDGSGTVILKPLSRAVADGDHIYALIRGTATNQDGRTNGMTVPSQEAQEQVILDACHDGGVSPGEIQYVEAHGTGTGVGDPIEAAALAKVLRVGRNGGKPCIVGAVKTNIGHLESAAGIAGLMKTAMVLERGEIPSNLHFEAVNPAVNLSEAPLQFATEFQQWPADGTKLASVNSFGFGGANAHVVLERPPAVMDGSGRSNGADERDRLSLFCLSAKTPQALSAYASGYANFLANSACTLKDIAASQAITRSHFDHRLAISARTVDQLRDALLEYAAGTPPPALRMGVKDAAVSTTPIVFVFSGQGPQWWGMGRELLKKNRVFAETVERVHTELTKHADWSLMEELTKDEASSRIGETSIAQPALFAVQVGLAALWKHWGYMPGAVIGHSIGEVAAAYVSGALSFEQTVQVIFHRSRVQQKASGKGKMLAVGLAPEEIERRIEVYRGRICVAAINGPDSVTLAGDVDAIEEVERGLASEKIFCRMLQVNVAFHSHQMDPLEHELKHALRDLKPLAPVIPMYSTVTGQTVMPGELDATYWWRNVREPVCFAPTVRRLIADGHQIFLELGPHPIHSTGLSEMLAQARKEGLVASSLVRQQPDVETLMGSVATLYTHGLSPRWDAVHEESRQRVKIPHYPWQRERQWLESETSRRQRFPSLGHPLVGESIGSPDVPGRHVWQVVLDPLHFGWLEDHRIQGPIVFPAAAYIDMMLGCARSALGDGEGTLENVAFRRALFIFDDKPPPIAQVVLSPDRSISVFSHQAGEAEWTLHATASLGTPRAVTSPSDSIAELQARCGEEIATADFYKKLNYNGLLLGPTFKVITQLWRGDGKSLGRIETPLAVMGDAPRHEIHPGILDSCFQSNAVGMGFETHSNLVQLYLPVEVQRISYFNKPGERVYCYGEARPIKNTEYCHGDFWILNEDHTLVAHLEGFRGKSITRASDESDAVMQWLYDFEWRPDPLPSKTRLPADFIPSGTALIDATAAVVQELKDWSVNRTYYAVAEAKMNRLCIAYVTEAFQSLGFRFTPGRRFAFNELVAEMGVDEKHLQYLRRQVDLLVQHEILTPSGNEWTVVTSPTRVNADEILTQLRREHPELESEYVVLDRCGKGQVSVLRGEVNPIELIFAEGEFKSVVDLYGTSFSFSKSNRIAHQVFEACMAHRPEDRPVRILEIGAGTGGTTEFLLPILQQGGVEYVYTDVTQLFLNNARERFSQYSFVDYRILDVERDVAEQDIDLHYFDVVIASNVIHATLDMKATLANVRRLMTSRALLLVVEATSVPHWVDLTVGMTEGWWRFQDRDLRPSYPTLSEGQWAEFLPKIGFEDVYVVSDKNTPEQTGNSILLARAPEIDLAPWQPQVERGPWVVLADSTQIGNHFIRMLGEHGIGSVVVTRGTSLRERSEGHFEVDPADAAQLKRVLEHVRREAGSCSGALHLWNLDLYRTELDAATLHAAERDGAYSVVALAQALEQIDWPLPPRLWLATRSSQKIAATDELSLAQVPVWGLLRVLLNERPELRAKIVDLGVDESPEQDARHLYHEYLLARGIEPEIAYRGGVRHVHRLQHQSAAKLEAAAASMVRVSEQRFTLLPPPEREIDQLHYTAIYEPTIGAGEVEIRVTAAGLNFRDVMLTLGLLSEGATSGGFYGENVGVECAGVVSRVGADVVDLEPGDRVIAFARGCLGTYVTTPAILVLKNPMGMQDAEAATLPMAYLTAYYSLVTVGRTKKDDHVLIHAAAGGVGLAAVHVARALGANVYATAGSHEKRAYLRSLGVEHVFDSRSFAFAEEVRSASGGTGVDVVLNSLQGDYIVKSLELLKPCGRFLEIGKKDIYENFKLGLRPFGNNLNYSAIDIDRLLLEVPGLCRQVMNEVLSGVSSGALPALPRTEFGAARVGEAFRYMVAAKQTGKIVVTYEDNETVALHPAPIRGNLFAADASYLVTGGLSGFGLRTAQWLVENGAGTVVLVGRRGRIDDQNRSSIAWMQAQGASVIVEKADVSVEQDVAALLGRFKDRPPLRGIFHAAMVLDDVVLATMTQEQFMRAVIPKVDAGWHLHCQTLELPIDYFVMYSSLTWIVGTPGQGNYAAANGFLEALARHRQALGLPALTVNWGAIGEVGFLARGKPDALSRMGWVAISPANAMKVIKHCLLHKVAATSAFGVNWGKMSQVMPTLQTSPSFSHLIVEDAEASIGEGAQDQDLRRELSSLDSDARSLRLVIALSQQIGRVFDMSVDRLSVDVALTDLGMDSLMAGQIRNWLAKRLEIDFPIMGLMRGPTITQLASDILTRLFGAATATSGPPISEIEVNSTPSPDRWFYQPKARSETASLRIFGVPFGGGGASVFGSWPANLPETVEVVGIQLPGRETRIAEPPIDQMSQLVEALGEAMLPYLDRSFVIYGHSMGALVSFELARYLQEKYSEIPAKLMVGGWPSPALVQSYVRSLKGVGEAIDLGKESDERVVEVLRVNRLLGNENIADQAFVNLMMKSVRADLKILGDYRFDPTVKLRCPITVLHGRDDHLFTTEQLSEWEPLTTGSFSLRSVPGGHLFIRGAAHDLFNVISEELSSGVFPSFMHMATAAE
jgi:acyl transferase domain-containing protein/surfactin synthase thioesterase subunit